MVRASPAADAGRSPALSQIATEPGPIAGRMIGIVAGAGADLAGIGKIRMAAAKLGATALVIAPIGGVLGSGTHTQTVDRTLLTARSVEFDALVVASGTTAPSDIKLTLLLQEAFRHCKVLAAWGDGTAVLEAAGDGLQSLVAGRHVVGVTTNPTIFASALSRGDRYNDQLADLATRNTDVDTAVLAVTTDVRAGCHVLAPVYAQTAGLDGCVSIEVDPRLSRDAAATAEMARRLWTTANRDNLYIKIPATESPAATTPPANSLTS